MQWEAYRSREIIWVKPRANLRGEREVYTKDGKIIPEEALKRQWEKVDTSPATEQTHSDVVVQNTSWHIEDLSSALEKLIHRLERNVY